MEDILITWHEGGQLRGIIIQAPSTTIALICFDKARAEDGKSIVPATARIFKEAACALH